jgi:hypothetical protein
MAIYRMAQQTAASKALNRGFPRGGVAQTAHLNGPENSYSQFGMSR